MPIYKLLESVSAKNTDVAASSSEIVITEPSRHDYYNSLEVYNRDNVAIEVRLDSLTSGAKVYQCPANTVMVLEADEGILFKEVKQVNLSASTAETADAIFFKAMVKEIVG